MLEEEIEIAWSFVGLNFIARLCTLHGGLICIAFRLSVCPSMTRQKVLDNNSHLQKYCT